MRQINALLTQLDAKKRDHFEFVAKELQELQDCGKLNEVFIIVYIFALWFGIDLKLIVFFTLESSLL